MSFFEDKEYENLDWLNKAIEPYTLSLNDKLSELENEYILTIEDLNAGGRSVSVSLSHILNKRFKEKGISFSLNDTVIGAELFDFHVDPDTTVDFRTGEINKPILVKKKKHVFTDEELPEIAVKYIMRVIDYSSWRIYGDSSISRTNEVMDIIGCTRYKNSKKAINKCIEITNRLIDIVKNTEWNVRNLDLMIKAAQWIMNYIERGDLSGITNLTKLKCMTHSGNPIYSMKEIV